MHTDALGVRGCSGITLLMLLAGKEVVPSKALLASPVPSEQASFFANTCMLRNHRLINTRTLRFS